MGTKDRSMSAARAKTQVPANTRAQWGTLSRSQIVAAATKAVKGGGYASMTIRSLAAQIGVSPMSLYRYVRDKDDLLDEVVDALLEEVWRPAASEDEWRAWIAEAADNLRRFLVREPAALRVYLVHPVVSKAALERMEAMLGVLGQAGLDNEAALSAYGAIHTYTIGFAALEASRRRDARIQHDADVLARQLAAFTTPQRFVEGLGYLLEGISSRSARETRERGPRSTARTSETPR